MGERYAFFGGIYNNAIALEAVLEDARARGARETWFLGDVGGFGPHPERAIDVLRRENVPGIAGNYDISIAEGRTDCGCGYTDPMDRHFAQVSYDYTLSRTRDDARAYLASLPRSARLEIGGSAVTLAHGSPRRVNEFLWESSTSDAYLKQLLDETRSDVLLVTHTGLHWHRVVDGRHVVNVGAIGRPANDGVRCAWYTLLEMRDDGTGRDDLVVTFIPVDYDWQTLAREIREERLPEAFAETIETGWWTTCLENMPAKERSRGRH